MDDGDPLQATSPRCSSHPRHNTTTALSSATPASSSLHGGVAKLGDFSRLHAEAASLLVLPKFDSVATSTIGIDSKAAKMAPRSLSPSEPSPRSQINTLGNFFKIYAELGVLGSARAPPTSSNRVAETPIYRDSRARIEDTSFAKTNGITNSSLDTAPAISAATVPATLRKHTHSTRRQRQNTRTTRLGNVNGILESESDGDRWDGNLDESVLQALAESPPSSAERDGLPRGKYRHILEEDTFWCYAGAMSPSYNPDCQFSSAEARHAQSMTAVVHVQTHKDGPSYSVMGPALSAEEKHECLTTSLTAQCVLDVAIGRGIPDVAINGIHVFLDMSNINISFQHTLKNRYHVPAHVRFKPLPSLNLKFLHEIITRGRRIKKLSAGCSTMPWWTDEPAYVRELRSLGYHVDLRARKPAEDAKQKRSTSNPLLSFLDNNNNYNSSISKRSPQNSRYVEDLVDETLQTRIGESVMEYFELPGTIVLATGDAKPAKFSDGFFAYAERALKMGWNVEIVSWKCSLSSSWRNLGLEADWGDSFRIIELDNFVDYLLV